MKISEHDAYQLALLVMEHYQQWLDGGRKKPLTAQEIADIIASKPIREMTR